MDQAIRRQRKAAGCHAPAELSKRATTNDPQNETATGRQTHPTLNYSPTSIHLETRWRGKGEWISAPGFPAPGNARLAIRTRMDMTSDTVRRAQYADRSNANHLCSSPIRSRL